MSGKSIQSAEVLPFTYDGVHPHAVAAYDGNTYRYDLNGNQVERVIDGVTYSLRREHWADGDQERQRHDIRPAAPTCDFGVRQQYV